MYIDLIESLTEICIKQASIIQDQAFALAQLGAEVREDEVEKQQDRLWRLLNYWGLGYGKDW